MSAGQTSRYRVARTPQAIAPWLVLDAGEPFDASYSFVDGFRSETAAHHAANMLNRGIAVIDPHAIVGCKVIAR